MILWFEAFKFQYHWLFLSLLKRIKYMSSQSFVSGRGITFIIDGPEVEILQDARPAARVPFVDLLEFAQSQTLKSSPLKASNKIPEQSLASIK